MGASGDKIHGKYRMKMKGSRNVLQQLSHIFIYTPSFSKLSPSHTSHTHTHTAQRPTPSKHGNWVHCLYSSKQHRLRIKRHTTNTASQKITERKRPRVYHGTHASGVHVSPSAVCLSPAPLCIGAAAANQRVAGVPFAPSRSDCGLCYSG